MNLKVHRFIRQFSASSIIPRPPSIGFKALSSLNNFASTVQKHGNNLSSLLNELTGYDVVEKRKERVLAKDALLHAVKQEFAKTKESYEMLIEDRRRNQKDLDALKDRKNTMEDIQTLTNLYKKQLSLEQQEQLAKIAYKKATDDFERIQMEYLSEMRERYIEEQLYSDKIRRASTWWTWGLITTHLFLFLIIQLVVEPHKRRELKSELLQMLQENSTRDRNDLQQAISKLSSESLSLPESFPQSLDKPDKIHSSEQQQHPLKVQDLLESHDYWKGIGMGAGLSMIFLLLRPGP